MKYPIGTIVYLKHTADRGVVISFDGSVYQIRLAEGYEIPAFEDDLTLSNPGMASPPGKTPSVQSEIKPNEPKVIYATRQISQPRGVYLALEGLFSRDGYVQNYRCWLVNEMPFAFIADLDAYIGAKTFFTLSQRIAPESAIEAGTFHYDEINDHPDLELAIRRITTAGLDPEIVKVHRLKGKTIIQAQSVTAIVDRPVWVIDFFNAQACTAQSDAEEDLASYAKGLTPKKPKSSNMYRPIRDIREIAAFSTEIDLHIEALVDHKGKMSNAEIMQLQMASFEAYMDKAMRMNVSSVFIIHGVGEGVLKSAIADRLRNYVQVDKFYNRYHPKYGYGATEVIFK